MLFGVRAGSPFSSGSSVIRIIVPALVIGSNSIFAPVTAPSVSCYIGSISTLCTPFQQRCFSLLSALRLPVASPLPGCVSRSRRMLLISVSTRPSTRAILLVLAAQPTSSSSKFPTPSLNFTVIGSRTSVSNTSKIRQRYPPPFTMRSVVSHVLLHDLLVSRSLAAFLFAWVLPFWPCSLGCGRLTGGSHSDLPPAFRFSSSIFCCSFKKHHPQKPVRVSMSIERSIVCRHILSFLSRADSKIT